MAISDDPKLRIRVMDGSQVGRFASSNPDPTSAITIDSSDVARDSIPAKEWSITDDILNISDSACVTVDNIKGRNTGRFKLGQRIEMDESDPGVQNGAWMRCFTGRIIGLRTGGGNSGSEIRISAMDLGWHLTMCHTIPHIQLAKGQVSLDRLIAADGTGILIDRTWGFAPTDARGNITNRLLKQGRVTQVRTYQTQKGLIHPYIQTEPGQAPFEILSTYAKREGLLLNVGAGGQLILFRPDFTQDISYEVEYHNVGDSRNNVVEPPSLDEKIDGLYSEVQCWSTLVNPISSDGAITDNPNQACVHTVYIPTLNPLPFYRRQVFSDSEAIGPDMRMNRCVWKQQMDAFNSWEYTAKFNGHSQRGSFFVSDTRLTVNDDINFPPSFGGPKAYYVQSVHKTYTKSNGAQTQLTVRNGKLDPYLTATKI